MSATTLTPAGNPTGQTVVDQVASATGLSPQLLQAQFNLETAYGTSPVWEQNANPAGIHYTGAPGQTVGLPAPSGGHYAAFTNPAQGWISFLQSNPRYSNVPSAVGNPAEQAALLQADGWSTNPAYAQTLDQMMGVQPYTGSLPGTSGSAVSTAGSAGSSGSSGGASSPYGVNGIGGTATAIGWTIVGAALFIVGIWLLFNPFADLTRVISGTAKSLARQPLAGATRQVASLPRRIQSGKSQGASPKVREIRYKRSKFAIR